MAKRGQKITVDDDFRFFLKEQAAQQKTTVMELTRRVIGIETKPKKKER